MNRQGRILRANPDCDCQACETEELQLQGKSRGWRSKIFFATLVTALCIIGSCRLVGAQPVPGSMLSAHFSMAEFNQHQAPLPADQIMVDPQLVRKLESLRRICRNRPIIVTSGYRSPGYNAKVGGAAHSQHMTGRAADIRVDGIDNRMLANYARIVGFTFVKVYSTHVHVDVR